MAASCRGCSDSLDAPWRGGALAHSAVDSGIGELLPPRRAPRRRARAALRGERAPERGRIRVRVVAGSAPSPASNGNAVVFRDDPGIARSRLLDPGLRRISLDAL